jgi:hypothetical protein
MPRRKKGEVKEALVKILSEAYPEPIRFYLLKQKLESRLKNGGRISNKVIFENLKKLEKEGQVERTRDGWREVRFYPESRARTFIQKIAGDSLPVNIDWTGHSLTPFIEIGHERDTSSSPPQGLEAAARERFGLEVKKLLAGMNEQEKRRTMDFFASALWLGYKFFSAHPSSEEVKFKSPKELFETKLKSELGKHYLAEYISQGTRNYFGNKVSIAEYKLLLLAYALLDQIHHSVAQTPPSEKANLRRMSRSGIVLDFLKNVAKIKFAYILTVGFDDLDEGLTKLIRLQHLDRWIRDLNQHSDLELKLVEKAMKEAADRVEHGMPPEETPLPHLNLTPKDIYDFHPRGKDPGFYLKIVEMILKALKAKETLPDPTKS